MEQVTVYTPGKRLAFGPARFRQAPITRELMQCHHSRCNKLFSCDKNEVEKHTTMGFRFCSQYCVRQHIRERMGWWHE